MPQDEYFEAQRMPRVASSASPGQHAGEVWGDVPLERRRRWTQMMLDFPPRFLGVIAMNHLAVGGVSNVEEWAYTARSFEAAGFTPEQFHWLQVCLRQELGEAPHPLVRVTTRGAIREVTLSAFDWVPWLRAIEDGVRPLAATRQVLSRRSGYLDVPLPTE